LARLVAEHEAKPAPVRERRTRWGPTTTVNDTIDTWRANGWDDLSPKTARHYESIWRVHIEPTIGRRRIVELGTYDVERFYRSLKSAGLSAATVYQVKAIHPPSPPRTGAPSPHRPTGRTRQAQAPQPAPH
jgi:hypothetical protein